MACSNCGRTTDKTERYCRACGADLVDNAIAPQKRALQNEITSPPATAPAKDPDELIGNGIGTMIMGDGFLITGVLLAAVESQVSSMLWSLLLLPAFVFFGIGFSNVLKAQQIRKRLKEQKTAGLPPAEPPPALADVFQNRVSGELISRPSVTERTTRQLK